MATTDEMFSFFDPEEADVRKNKPFAEGWYPCYVTKVYSKRGISVKGKYMADIYNVTVEIADEVRNQDYRVEQIDGSFKEESGAGYEGKTFRSKGLWHFLAPQLGDDFEANPTGNVGYYKFLEAVGVDMPEREIEIAGKLKKVRMLPHLEESDVKGLPVVVFAKLGKPWTDKEGKERQYFEATSFKVWEGKEKPTQADPDLPF